VSGDAGIAGVVKDRESKWCFEAARGVGPQGPAPFHTGVERSMEVVMDADRVTVL
jgi:hypothetical protein